MKKILLLLSCFLATWCGVQAASSSGKINSATYNASNSTISVNYTTNYASRAKLGLMSMQKGNSIYDPLSPTSLNVANVYNFSSTQSVKVDATWEECQFYVYLYLNGSNTPSCSGMSVNVTAHGRINSIAVSGNKATANYSMWHGSTYYSSLRIEKYNNKTKKYEPINKLSLSNPNTTKNVSLGTLEIGKYRCVLCTKEKELANKEFEIPTPPRHTGEIKLVEYVPNNRSVTVDYTLNNANKNPTVFIRDHWYNTIVGSMAVTNSSATKTIKFENVQLKDNYRYDVVLADNGEELYVKNLSTTAVDSDGPAYANNQITNLWYDRSSNKINVDFCLKRSGATVGFRLLSTKSGRWYSGGSWYCPQNCGSYFINVPNETGNVLYIVVLTVNGAEDGATKQIVISR